MASYIDSAYFSSLNPIDQGRKTGLAALAPTFGLSRSPAMTPLDPYSNLPAPQFSSDAADSFSWLPDAAMEDARANLGGYVETTRPSTNAPLPASQGGQAPYFDPNYPFESLSALKEWLSPQVASEIDQSQNARGLYSTGVGAYSQQSAKGYLDQLLPTGIDPLSMDLNRLYGPNITNSLEQGWTHHNDAGGFSATPQLPFGSPAGDGSTNAQAAFIRNPNPSFAPRPSQPGAGPLPAPHPGRITVMPLDPSQNTNPTPTSPLAGLFDYSTGQGYGGPGYFYDPNNMPDASKMPWLAPVTPAQPTQQTQPKQGNTTFLG